MSLSLEALQSNLFLKLSPESRRTVIVVSAIKGMTDLLLGGYKSRHTKCFAWMKHKKFPISPHIDLCLENMLRMRQVPCPVPTAKR